MILHISFKCQVPPNSIDVRLLNLENPSLMDWHYRSAEERKSFVLLTSVQLPCIGRLSFEWMFLKINTE